MASFAERLAEIDRQIKRAEALTEADPGASRVLVAVVKEFRKKSKMALEIANSAGPAKTREAIVELEQAADSALRAVEVDTYVDVRTREAVTRAHDVVRDLKEELEP